MTTTERLKPSWFYHFLVNPTGYRPRIVMPRLLARRQSGAEDRCSHGNTDRQIEAIWYYLSLGTSAADPSGIRPVETKIEVSDRRRAPIAGAAAWPAIAASPSAFPIALSYAFNAETGTLTALWRGDFLRVDRSGQGSGAFQSGEPIRATRPGCFVLALPSEQAPWPLRPVMTKEAPVNPDPLYPKNRGYQFKGYYLDDAVDSHVHVSQRRHRDRRPLDRRHSERQAQCSNATIHFSAPRDETIWFRADRQDRKRDRPAGIEIPELRLTIPPAKALLRALAVDKPAAAERNATGATDTAADHSATELLLKLDIPQGKSMSTFTYELFPKP